VSAEAQKIGHFIKIKPLKLTEGRKDAGLHGHKYIKN
jgi:hypothetical protein